MTGYTGKLASKYVVENCAIDLKWAVAGRSPTKLTSLINEINQVNSIRRPPGLLVADSNDFDALTSLAQSTKVVVSFAGPFAKFPLPVLFGRLRNRFGSKLVQACAENGTHYADITGETPWYARSLSCCTDSEDPRNHSQISSKTNLGIINSSP